MTNVNKAIEDRSNSIRIQYNTEDRVPSSITIDPKIYGLLEAKFGDAKGWLQNKAKEKRSELLREATKLAENRELFKRVKGERVSITPEEYIRGKISASVREDAIDQIAEASLVAKVNFKE
jgi:hypothetical protein